MTIEGDDQIEMGGINTMVYMACNFAASLLNYYNDGEREERDCDDIICDHLLDCMVSDPPFHFVYYYVTAHHLKLNESLRHFIFIVLNTTKIK